MPEAITTPDTAEISRDLEYMIERWGELSEPAQFELRAFKEDYQPQTALFTPTRIEEAVEWAEGMNERGYNIYSVRNPINMSVTRSAKDDDIIASFFLWADCDEPQAADNVLRFDGPKWAAAVTTGTVPSTRAHTYWMLAEPCYDLAAWREMQATIAQHFGSDRAVINPSRIMRIGGTVAYPAKHKQERGYIKEVAVLRTDYPEERPPVTLDQMRRVFGANQTPIIAAGNTFSEPMDRERAAVQALSGQEWNNTVLRMVGSYVRKGLSDGEIHALTDPLTLAGYTVDDTRREVQNMINRTRSNPKFDVQPATETNFDHPPATAPQTINPTGPSWRVQTADEFTEGFVAPEYIIDGVVQRGRLYTLTAPTGSGKTAVMLMASIAMSNGQHVCDRETEQGDVVYLAGENPDDVRARLIATRERMNVTTPRLHFIEGTFSIRTDMEAVIAQIDRLPNCTMVIVDTLAAYFDGDDSNSNAQMLDFARVLRRLTTAKNKPAVIVPAHPVKNAQKNNLTPMGGSALLNEVDGNLCLWKRETAVELHWQGKHRGAEFEPLKFELVGITSDLVKDTKGRLMPTVMAQPLLEARAQEIATQAYTIKERLLLNVEQYDAQSITDRCVDIGLVNAKGVAKKSTLARMLQGLRDEKLVRSVLNNWFLTDKGKEAVQIIKDGGAPPELEAE